MREVGVIGLGKSGKSAREFLESRGYRVWATDDKLQEGAISAEEFVQKDFEFVVISPGVPLSHKAAVAITYKNIPLFCDVELAFRNIRNRKALGITGSNGKTTTTSLTAHILQAKAVGNIGLPILSELDDGKETLVIELSSFQLETMSANALDAACILNITPNHLDRHGTMEAYAAAKGRIELCLKPDGALWVKDGLKGHFHFGFDPRCDLYSDGMHLFRFGQKEEGLPDSLQGKFSYEVENYMAAYALCRHLDTAPEVCRAAFDTFTKPKHRLQYVATKNGFHFYDDSKATSVDAVLRAVESIQNPIVLIAGGVHKGYPYHVWQKPFKDKVRACVLIGEAKELIEKDLEHAVPTLFADSLEEALQKAMQLAIQQDAILLSPGCASYDMFSSYEERGNKFQELVNAL